MEGTIQTRWTFIQGKWGRLEILQDIIGRVIYPHSTKADPVFFLTLPVTIDIPIYFHPVVISKDQVYEQEPTSEVEPHSEAPST